MAHLQASSRYLALLLCFIPVLVLAQQPMTIGVKTYATSWQFQKANNFSPAPSQGPEATFSNAAIVGAGIYYERRSPAGFSWSAEAGILDVRHQVSITGGHTFHSLSAPLYRFSLQAGYRFGLGDQFNLGLFTGAGRYLYKGNVSGTMWDFELDNNTLWVGQWQSWMWKMPLRLEAQYALSDRWLLSAGVEAIVDIGGFDWHQYTFDVYDASDQVISTSLYTYGLLPVSATLGIYYQL